MLEKIGRPGFETISTPDAVVLECLDDVMSRKVDPVVYEVGVGVGATTVELAKRMNNSGSLLLFSREPDVLELAADLKRLGFTNVQDQWGSKTATYSGYHFDLAVGFVNNALPRFDLAYLDGGHVFHLDAAAACVLKELALPGGFLILDDYYWSLEKSPTLNPTARPQTAKEYDEAQIKECHVSLVCRALIDVDPRFEFLGLQKNTAVYRRRPEN